MESRKNDLIYFVWMFFKRGFRGGFRGGFGGI